MHYVYILKSQNKDWYYIGNTANVEQRLSQHNAGMTKSTKAHAPFSIFLVETYVTKTEAIQREQRIKKNHALKKALIPGLK